MCVSLPLFLCVCVCVGQRQREGEDREGVSLYGVQNQVMGSNGRSRCKTQRDDRKEDELREGDQMWTHSVQSKASRMCVDTLTQAPAQKLKLLATAMALARQ